MFVRLNHAGLLGRDGFRKSACLNFRTCTDLVSALSVELGRRRREVAGSSINEPSKVFPLNA
jgi:hypothetical protein